MKSETEDLARGTSIGPPLLNLVGVARMAQEHDVLAKDVETGTKRSDLIAIAAVIVVALSLRPMIVSVGPVLPAIIETFGLSHAQASLLTAIPDLLMGLLALPTPWLAHRFGRDKVIVAALILLASAAIARSAATGVTSLLWTTAGAGAGIAIAGALIAGFIKEKFATRAAFYMGIYATALSLGSTAAAGLTGPMATANGNWRTVIGLWGGTAAIGGLAWIVMSVWNNRRAGGRPVSTGVHQLPFGSLKAWAVALFFAMNNLLFYAIVAWTPTIYQEAGRSTAQSSLILATFMFVFTCANPLFGILSRSRDRRLWLAIAGAFATTGLIGLTISANSAPFLWVALSAFGLGGTFTLGMTLPLDNTSSVGEANSWNAMVLLVGYLLAGLGPLGTGFFRDLTGRFETSLWLLVVCAAFMTLLSVTLRPRGEHL